MSRCLYFFFFSSRRRHTRFDCDWSSDVCSSDLYENPQYYDTLHRAQQEAPYRPIHIAKSLVSVFQHGLSLVAMAGLLLSLHWSLALIVLVAVAPEVMVHLKYANAYYAWRRQRTVTERYAQYYDWM